MLTNTKGLEKSIKIICQILTNMSDIKVLTNMVWHLYACAYECADFCDWKTPSHKCYNWMVWSQCVYKDELQVKNAKIIMQTTKKKPNENNLGLTKFIFWKNGTIQWWNLWSQRTNLFSVDLFSLLQVSCMQQLF